MQQETQTHAPKLHTTQITIPINNISSQSTSSMSQQQQTTTITTAINTEEFAKLDALLEDLLAEVEQPILLNKYNENLTHTESCMAHQHQIRNIPIHNSNPDNDIERSVDWLNEQKEILRSRKEQCKGSTVKVSDSQIKYADVSSPKGGMFEEHNSRDR